MCRQLICDPETPNKALRGELDSIRHCVACSEGCGMVTQQEGVVCVQNPAAGREKRLGIGTLKPTAEPKQILVIGAGIAGLKTAEILAARGHHVRVLEKTMQIGGQMLLAEKIPMRAEMGEIYRYLRVRLQEMGVPVELGCEASVETVRTEKPDAVVVATGSYPTLPVFERAGMPVLDPRTVLEHFEKIGQNVVLIDRIGYWQAMGVADSIAALGAKVTIVTDRLYVGVDIEETCREDLNLRLAKSGAVSITSHRLKDVDGDHVILENVFNHAEQTLTGVDTMVFAQESRSDNALYRALKQEALCPTYCVGDAAAPGTVLRIIFEAEELGRKL